MKIQPHWDIVSHLSDWQKFNFDNKVCRQNSGESGTLNNYWRKYKRSTPVEENLAIPSEVIYAFALYPGNLLLGNFPKDTPAKL